MVLSKLWWENRKEDQSYFDAMLDVVRNLDCNFQPKLSS
jgi:hypothetical protein